MIETAMIETISDLFLLIMIFLVYLFVIVCVHNDRKKIDWLKNEIDFHLYNEHHFKRGRKK